MNNYIKHYDNPFEQNSAERDYWLGWIFSDGCIQNNKERRIYQLYLACKDLDTIQKFKDFCGDRAKLTSFKYITPKSKETKIIYKVLISSKELVEYFKEKFNISGKKSESLNPDIELNWDIMRGVYDGDGSFKKGVVITSMSKDWINKISKFYDDNNLHYTIIQDSAYRLSIYKKADIKKIYHLLYDNTDLYLSRKKIDLSRLVGE